MNGLPYYKAYPRDFLEGTIGMPFELKAAYRLVLDLIYMQGGDLPDDARYISGLLGCSMRKWTSLRAELIRREKLIVNDGNLNNRRADSEIDNLGRYSKDQSKRRSRPNKAKSDPEDDTIEIDPPTPIAAPPKAHCDVPEATRDYNAAAKAYGWPEVQKLTKPRASALRARLKDVGGIEGWRVALERAGQSDFLCGRSGSRQWNGFGFDWITKQSNFNKLMEGNYDNRTDNTGGGGSGTSAASKDRIADEIAWAAGISQT